MFHDGGPRAVRLRAAVDVDAVVGEIDDPVFRNAVLGIQDGRVAQVLAKRRVRDFDQ